MLKEKEDIKKKRGKKRMAEWEIKRERIKKRKKRSGE